MLVVTLAGCSSTDEQKPAETEAEELTQEQQQSLAMMNHLIFITQEMIQYQKNQLYLDDIYNELTNNINPEAVDVKVEELMTSMLTSLKDFKLLETQRERLQFVYEQERANTLEKQLDATTADVVAVVSNPKATKVEWAVTALKTTVSVGRMIFGDVKTAAELEIQYTKDGWVLDDKATEEVHTRREELFAYRAQMVREENLPAKYTLNEEAVSQFVEWKYNDNLTSRIQFFESHQETYKYFNEYWLTLASCYYDNEDYQKCLDAVKEYEKINGEVSIFRNDYDYANILPLCIVSAREVYEQDQYIKLANTYLPLIAENSRDEDWINRYFVAQAYVDLYELTDDTKYLENAYNVILNLSNTLTMEQRKINQQYLDDVAVSQVDLSGKNALSFAQMLEELRKTEFPPVSEPLRMSTELLFALAEKLNVSYAEKEKITKMLHNDGEDLFYNLIYDNAVRFDKDPTDPEIAELTVKYNLDTGLKIPLVMLTEDSVIKVSAVGKNKTTVFEDWILTKVERKNKNVEEFLAVYKSKKASNFEYKNGMDIVVEIYADSTAETPDYTIKFETKVETTLLLFEDISFKLVS